jgi:flagellar L-ring protein precursor FlgH
MKTKYKLDFSLLVVFLACSSGGLTNLLAGSLWREAVTEERGMFADKRARRVGDIITIVVNESLVGSNLIRRDSVRNPQGTKAGLGTNLINQFIAGVQSKDNIPSAAPKRKATFPDNLLPRPQEDTPTILSPENTLSIVQNSDQVRQTQTLITQMAVQVIDVLPNGNLVLEGLRQIAFSEERVFATLRGIVRPYDVTAQNTIPSSLVADVRLDVIPEGSLSVAQRKGWLQKIDEKISPW